MISTGTFIVNIAIVSHEYWKLTRAYWRHLLGTWTALRALSAPVTITVGLDLCCIRVIWLSLGSRHTSSPWPMWRKRLVSHIHRSFLLSASFDGLLTNAISYHLGDGCSLRCTTKGLMPLVAKPTWSSLKRGRGRIYRSSGWILPACFCCRCGNALNYNKSAPFLTKSRGCSCCCCFCAFLACQTVARTLLLYILWAKPAQRLDGGSFAASPWFLVLGCGLGDQVLYPGISEGADDFAFFGLSRWRRLLGPFFWVWLLLESRLILELDSSWSENWTCLLPMTLFLVT